MWLTSQLWEWESPLLLRNTRKLFGVFDKNTTPFLKIYRSMWPQTAYFHYHLNWCWNSFIWISNGGDRVAALYGLENCISTYLTFSSFINYLNNFISFHSISTKHCASKVFSEVSMFVIDPFEKWKWIKWINGLDSQRMENCHQISASHMRFRYSELRGKVLIDILPYFKTKFKVYINVLRWIIISDCFCLTT
jgi:hypothetical protein